MNDGLLWVEVNRVSQPDPNIDAVPHILPLGCNLVQVIAKDEL